MPENKYLEILKSSVGNWNNWREDNARDLPDLSNTDLESMNLANVDFRNVDLTNTSLNNADLRGAQLQFANLSHSSLILANFERAFLENTDFKKAKMGFTKFLDTNLMDAISLDSIEHIGPSYIDLLTLAKSHGHIPLEFLKGAGVTETKKVAEFVLPVFKNQAIRFYSAFICHNSNDGVFAKKLYTDLKGSGVAVWFSPENLSIGDELVPRINEEIRMRDKLVVILSLNSLRSSWVEREIKLALQEEIKHKKTVLFPIRVDDSIETAQEWWANEIWAGRHIGDFRNWDDSTSYKKAFEKLINDLKNNSGNTKKEIT